MRRSYRVRAAVAALALIGGVLAWSASPAGAATLVVGPGQSIQAAVDAAPPGSTILVQPGTYAEQVTITKSGIRLTGAGRGLTQLVPPATPGGPCELEPGFTIGICVIGNFDFKTFTLLSPVSGVTVSGFAVSGFGGSGILVLGGNGTTLDNNRLDNNGEYGVFANTSTGTRIRNSRATGNDEAGFYVGDSPNANAFVTGNTATNNGFGIFIRSASKGAITNNILQDNCMGLLFLGEPNEPSGWTATGNQANHNNRACPASEEGPPVSGIGIQVLGGHDLNITGNTANDNQASGPTLGSAGIGVIEGNNVSVDRNTALGNDPDLFWDGTGAGNRFTGNICATSIPPGLCPGI